VQLSLEGRVILVTGGSRGIGAAIARGAAEAGADVAIVYRENVVAAGTVVDEIRALGRRADAYRCDVSKLAEVGAAVARIQADFGHLDGLVNNAGLPQVGPFLDLDPAEWERVIATDLSAAYYTIRAVVPQMLEQGSGAIVNIASRLGQMGITESAAYSAAKAGLIGLTRSLARELGPHGIRVNAVAPGFTITEMTADLAESDAGRSRLRDMPVGRFGRAEEVADAVIFLLSDAASLFLGQTLNPNGGGYMP
jgi:3-oxoacyl-[acyl-carrier protein] reductase